jgi:phenylacetate-CoA ligase
MIFDNKYECLGKEDLEQIQVEHLQTTLNRVYQNVAFYNDLFDSSGVSIEKIKSVQDIKHLPFTTKNDLLLRYPYDMFAVPLKDIVRIHSTSGTTARPIVVGYTRGDIGIWSSLIARILAASSIDEHDFVQIAFNYNTSSAGLGFHYGAEKIGASVIPSSTDNIARQIQIMKDYKTTALISIPGFALQIANALSEMNIDPCSLDLKTGLFGGEAWSENLRSEIEKGLNIKAYDNYGITELIGPGISYECEYRNGLHINEDHFIVEVINPDTLEPVSFGEEGELVFTTITKQGFPLIRYRTGDISSLIEDRCKCGRTFVKMKRVTGRTDDMMIVNGINIFPSQIEECLLQIEGVEPHYQIILDCFAGSDIMEIQVEATNIIQFFDKVGSIETLKERIQKHIEDCTQIRPVVTFVEKKSIKRSDGNKSRHVIDKRAK